MNKPQHMVGIRFNEVVPGMPDELTYLAQLNKGMLLNMQDLNLDLRMKLFGSPNAHNTMATLFAGADEAQRFCTGLAIYGDNLVSARTIEHQAGLHVERMATTPTIAFAKAGHSTGEAQTYVMQVMLYADDPHVTAKTSLVDRIVARAGGSRFELLEIMSKGLFASSEISNRADGMIPWAKKEGRVPLFYEIADMATFHKCSDEMRRYNLGTAQRNLRL